MVCLGSYFDNAYRSLYADLIRDGIDSVEAKERARKGARGLTTRELLNRAQIAGLPLVTYEKMSFGTWDSLRRGDGILEATEHAVAFARGEGSHNILTLAGARGVGKTHLIIAAAWEMLERGYLIAYRNASQLIQEVREDTLSASEQSGVDRFSALDTLKKVPVLFIDDLGIERLTVLAEETMDVLIDHRWLNELPIMITTNAKSVDLPPRIADRLGDVNQCKVIQIVAESYRTGV